MQALAAMTGAVMVDENVGIDLSEHGLDICGKASYVRISKQDTLIRGAAESDGREAANMRERVADMLEKAKEDYEKETLRITLSLLRNGVAIIKVGGKTELEMFERKDLYESAVAVAHASAADGVVIGGGCALLWAIPAIHDLSDMLTGDERLGAQIISKALSAPVFHIVENAGFDGSSVVAHLLEWRDPGLGFDVVTGEYCNLVSRGILDSSRSVKAAFLNAESAAQILLTAGAGVF